MLELTDEQWRERLTPEQYAVLREKGTEAPFSGELLENTDKGLYICGACGEVLFESNTKFDSHCGWPNFYQPINKNALHLVEDWSHNMHRIEITCGNCRSHLGHVFNDSPEQPTGLRFCVSSVALTFKKEQ